MASRKTNEDIYELLGEIRESQRNASKELTEMARIHKEHILEDKKEFAELNTNIDKMNRYYGYVGTVAGFIGGLVGFAVDYFFNRKS